ncbi:MAG TPA: hypothetical protein VFQ62_22185 [Methylomirabilota bacterium]|nr:hypothetical protein [Methylomirabilota bacterium]
MSGRRLRALVLVAAAVFASPARAEELIPVPAVVHLHSDLSTGQYSVEELAEMAERNGIGALLLSENYLNRVDYGVPPFRALTRVSRVSPSVHDRLGEYLGRVARARAARPGVLLIPGVEVMPHYRWSGSPLALELLVSDTQKNLLVWGLTDPATLAALPVIGNGDRGAYSLQSLLDSLPVLLLVPGIALLVVKRSRRRRVGPAIRRVPQRQWIAGLVLCGVAVATVIRGWPFADSGYSPYADPGMAPYQGVIDFVEQHGGAAVWSFPESRDFGTENVGPVRVTWSTEPYPDDLLRTFRYTAFGALYEETTRVERPGGAWDRMLVQYAGGERSRPAWGLGESGFHDTNAGKRLARVQTVFLVRERSEAEILKALRGGRLYARHRSPATALALTEFVASTDQARAVAGETLRPAAGAAVTVDIAIDAEGAPAADLKVVLVKNGEVANAWATTTPFRASHRETWDGRPMVFRLEARGGGGRLLSSAIFVRPS